MHHLSALLAVLATISLSNAHLVINYPGWRGDNLRSNGTVGVDDYSNSFPYGMQWAYPCGGMTVTTNRTYWPINGGAVSFQPGWFAGHLSGLIYINLGHGTVPKNYSHPMQKAFGIHGPTDESYPGLSICLPQVAPPADLPPFKEGDNATIQIVLAAQHGAALYSCADITFTNNMDLVETINDTNCYNDSQIGIETVFTTESLTAQSSTEARLTRSLTSVALVIGAVLLFMNL